MPRKVTHKIRLGLIYGIIIMCFAFKHPFYLGVCDLKYSASQKSLQGSIKLFTNDLESALTKLQGKKIDLIHPSDTLATTKLISDYVLKRFTIKVNNLPLNYKLIGFEKEQEAIWIYVEAKNCPLPQQIVFENSLLYDFLKEQINIIHLEISGKNQSLKAVYPEKTLKFEF